MTELERELRRIGVVPKQTKKPKPKPVVVEDAFRRPTFDANGEPDF